MNKSQFLEKRLDEDAYSAETFDLKYASCPAFTFPLYKTLHPLFSKPSPSNPSIKQ
jgi:hypothetical protein